MDYEGLSKKKNPFDGLDKTESRRLMVYFNYVAVPAVSIGEVARRWGRHLEADCQMPVFEAMEMADEIRGEIASSKTKREWRNRCDSAKHFGRSGKMKWLCAIVFFIAAIWGVRVLVRAQEQEFNRNVRSAKEYLPKIDELLISNPQKAYAEYTSIAKYSQVAIGRIRICKALGIGCPPQPYDPYNYSNHGCKLESSDKQFLTDVRKAIKRSDGKFDPTIETKIDKGLATLDDPDAVQRMFDQCVAQGEVEKAIEYAGRLINLNRIDIDADVEKIIKLADEIVAQDKKLDYRVLSLLETEGKKGSTSAQIWLAKYWHARLRCGDIWQKSSCREKALRWLLLAEKQGANADVYLMLSDCREDDRAQQILDLLAAEKLGSALASKKLGDLYKYRYEDVKAANHYRIAAEKGLSDAQLAYAQYLKDANEALTWVEKAAVQGLVKAQYESGERCEKLNNRARAVYWYRTAAKNGNRDAVHALARMEETLEP